MDLKMFSKLFLKIIQFNQKYEVSNKIFDEMKKKIQNIFLDVLQENFIKKSKFKN